MAAYSVRMTFLQQSGQCRYARSAKKAGKKGDKGSEYKHQYLHCGLRTAARFPFTSIAVDRDPKKDWRHITRPLDLYYSGDLFE